MSTTSSSTTTTTSSTSTTSSTTTTAPGDSDIYVRIRNSAGEVWYPDGAAFEDFDMSHETDYGLICYDDRYGTYHVPFPAAVPAGTYLLTAHQMVGAQSVDDPIISCRVWVWTGTEGKTLAQDAADKNFRKTHNVYDESGQNYGGVYPIVTKESGGVYP